MIKMRSTLERLLIKQIFSAEESYKLIQILKIHIAEHRNLKFSIIHEKLLEWFSWAHISEIGSVCIIFQYFIKKFTFYMLLKSP